jgi:hypothetical protein
MENTNLFSGFDFTNGLLKEPIQEFERKLEIFFPGDKYRILRYEIIDLFGIDQNIYGKVDENITIGKIFLLEIKIFKKHILDLLKDSDPAQQDILNKFLQLVNKNLTKVNSVLETDSGIPGILESHELLKLEGGAVGLDQQIQLNSLDINKYNKDQDPSLVQEKDLTTSVKKVVISEWTKNVDRIFESKDIEQAINQFVIQVFKSNGFKLVVEDTIKIKQIIKTMCVNLKIIDGARAKLEIYNKKYVGLGLDKSIRSIGSLRKTSVLLLTKTFLDKYLDLLLNVVDHKITMLEKIVGGNLQSDKKYLKYKIKYLLIKNFI